MRRTPTALASSYLDQLSSGGDGQKAPAVVAAEAPPKKKKGWFGRAAEEAPYVAPKFDAVDPAPPKVKAVEAAPAAAIVDADALSAQAAAPVASIKEEKETVAEPVEAPAATPAPAPAASGGYANPAAVEAPAEDISSFVGETMTPEYNSETAAVAGAALLAAGAVAVGLDIELASIAAVATAAVAVANETSSVGQLTRAVGKLGLLGYNRYKDWDEESGFSNKLKARAIESAIGVVEGAAESPSTAPVKKALKQALAVDDEDAVLVPVVAVASGQAVTVGGTNRTGTVAQCAANEWCTVEMDDDGSVETYRAPQLLKRETMPVPFDPASSGELMLKREAMDQRVAAALDAEDKFRNKGLRRAGVLVVGAGAVALATPAVRAVVVPAVAAGASRVRAVVGPAVGAVVSKVPAVGAVAGGVKAGAGAVASKAAGVAGAVGPAVGAAAGGTKAGAGYVVAKTGAAASCVASNTGPALGSCVAGVKTGAGYVAAKTAAGAGAVASGAQAGASAVATGAGPVVGSCVAGVKGGAGFVAAKTGAGVSCVASNAGPVASAACAKTAAVAGSAASLVNDGLLAAYDLTLAKVPTSTKAWRKLGTSCVKRLDSLYASTLGKL